MSDDNERTPLDDVLGMRVFDQRGITHVDLEQEAAPAVILTFGSSVLLIVPVTPEPDGDSAVVDIQAFHCGRPASNLMEHRITR